MKKYEFVAKITSTRGVTLFRDNDLVIKAENKKAATKEAQKVVRSKTISRDFPGYLDNTRNSPVPIERSGIGNYDVLHILYCKKEEIEETFKYLLQHYEGEVNTGNHSITYMGGERMIKIEGRE